MENKKTLVTIRVFFIIKTVLVIAGFINVVITLFSASAKEAPVGTFLMAYICLMIHAVWAYKKASIFYHAAGILSFTAIVTLIGKINQNVGGRFRRGGTGAVAGISAADAAIVNTVAGVACRW